MLKMCEIDTKNDIVDALEGFKKMTKEEIMNNTTALFFLRSEAEKKVKELNKSEKFREWCIRELRILGTVFYACYTPKRIKKRGLKFKCTR